MAGSQNHYTVVLFFAAGVFAVQQFAELPAPGRVWPAVLLAAWAWRRQWLRPAAIALLGVLWAMLRAQLILSHGLPPALEGRDIVVLGKVCSLPQSNERYTRFDLDVETLTHRGRPVASPGRIRLRVYNRLISVHAGQIWRLTVRLKRPHGFQNPGGFDYEAWLFRQRIRAVGYVRDHPGNERIQQAGFSLHAVRQSLRERINAALPQSSYRGLIVALAVGDRSGIDARSRETLQRTGTSHLIAISGLHVGLVAGLGYGLGMLLYRLSSGLQLYWPAPKFGTLLGLLSGLGYAALAGFSIPTQRAFIMLLVCAGALWSGRSVASWRVFCLALLLVLIWDPLAALDPSFWMSFGAVAVIIYLVNGRSTGRPRWRRWARIQLALSLGLMPIVAAVFQFVSVVSPIANFVAVPVFAFIVVPAALLGCLPALVNEPQLAGWFLHLADAVLSWIWPVLERLGQADVAVFPLTPASLFALLCALVGVLWLLAPAGTPARWMGALWLLPLMLGRSVDLTPGEFRLTVLDVGQGLSVVVRTARHTMVYDTGARFGPNFDIGAAVLVPFLRAQHARTIDTLVVSHGDNDHIGGLDSLLRLHPVQRRLSSVPDRVPASESCVPRRSWLWDGVHFEILSPWNTPTVDHNDSSCVIRVVGRHGTSLLTGDIERATEAKLVEAYGDRLKSDVLVVPHQGSKTSSTRGFLNTVQPQIAVVSAGYRNPYGHPHPEVVDRYRRMGTAVYDTPGSGAVSIRVGEGGIDVDTYRATYARYWFTRVGPQVEQERCRHGCRGGSCRYLAEIDRGHPGGRNRCID